MEVLTTLASNKMFVGVTMLLMNFGSRLVIGDLTQLQNSMLATDLAKKIIVFCIFFVPTRDIIVSIMLTFAFFFVVDGILNDKRDYAIIGNRENFDKDLDIDAYMESVKKRSIM